LYFTLILKHFQRIQDSRHGNALETDEVRKSLIVTDVKLKWELALLSAYFQRQLSLHFDQGQCYVFLC